MLILRNYEEMTLAEIAGLLDLPLGTVKSDLHRGLISLRAFLLTRGWEVED